MQETWLKPEEVEQLTQWSPKKLRRRAFESPIRFRELRGENANGRVSREYLLESLPVEFQQKFFSGALILATPANDGPNCAQIVPFQRSLPATEAPRIVLPDPKKQAEAERRLSVIARLDDYEKLTADEKRRLRRLKDGHRIGSRDDLARQIAIQTGIPRATILRWFDDYRKGSFPALARSTRADKGQSRWFSRHGEAAILAAYLYLNERQSITFVCEQIERDAAKLAIEEGDLPSRETVRIFLSQQISPAMRTLAREGQREYRERMSPYIRRGYTDVWANQIWVGDHMIHDVEVANDLFDDAPLGAPVRLRLSAMLDYRSRKLVGATWAWEGSSRAIAATMRRAILQFGRPEGIYVDNGKDYLKVAKGARRGCEPSAKDPFLQESPLAPDHWWQTELDAIERTGFLARLGIAVTHCIPRHPQSKHVERFFRTLHLRFDSVHSTYTSGSPATRPDQTEAAMMLHRRLFKKGRVAESNHPLASRFILGCLSWIEEYNGTPHQGEGMDGRSPNEVFQLELNPNQRPAPEPATLALLMAEYEKREVHECAVTLNKGRYTARPEDRMAWAAMHEANEREILIAYDPGDPECAAALTLDGHFLAWLEAEMLLRFAPGDEKTQSQIARSMEIRRGLEKSHKGALKMLEAAARSNGAQSGEEMLYSRLQLPAAAGAVISQRKSRLQADKRPKRPKTSGEAMREIAAMVG